MIPLQSSVTPSDGTQAPLRVILHESAHKGEWVTHTENMQTTDRFDGYYCPSIDEKGGEQGAYTRALREYVRRCKRFGVDPMPPLTPQAIPITPRRIDRNLPTILVPAPRKRRLTGIGSSARVELAFP